MVVGLYFLVEEDVVALMLLSGLRLRPFAGFGLLPFLSDPADYISLLLLLVLLLLFFLLFLNRKVVLLPDFPTKLIVPQSTASILASLPLLYLLLELFNIKSVV